MKAFLMFSGSGPVLFLTNFSDIDDPRMIEKLKHKGIKKFISYEVPINLAEEKYTSRYHAVAADLNKSGDLRVLDYNGDHVINNFSFRDLTKPYMYEEN
ncbi:MAG: hypothetical protein QMD92_02245 [bacterium]|nr:hypothetical protein [bacterium]